MQHLSFKPGRFFVIGFFLIFVVLVVDQYTKWLVLETVLRTKTDTPAFLDWFMTRRPLQYFMDQQEQYNSVVLAPWLSLVMVWNKGISFGILDLQKHDLSMVFIGLSLVISMALLIWMTFAHKPAVTLAAGLIIGGAIGNVCDRFRFHAVADFIDAHIGDHHWPAFNVADSAVVIGAFLLIADAIFFTGKTIPASSPSGG